jgi:hypothetical protein
LEVTLVGTCENQSLCSFECRKNQEVISESLERENERIENAMNSDDLQKLVRSL